MTKEALQLESNAPGCIAAARFLMCLNLAFNFYESTFDASSPCANSNKPGLLSLFSFNAITLSTPTFPFSMFFPSFFKTPILILQKSLPPCTTSSLFAQHLPFLQKHLLNTTLFLISRLLPSKFLLVTLPLLICFSGIVYSSSLMSVRFK
jgi:hypothetical protein